MAQHIVVARRSVGEFGQMQGSDLQGTGRPKRAMAVASSAAGLSARILAPQLGDLALAVEHVLVRQRHAGERAFACPRPHRRRPCARRERLVGFERDDAVGELVAGAQPVDRSFGRFRGSRLCLARMALASARAESVARSVIDLASRSRAPAEVIDIGAHRQLERDPAGGCRQDGRVRFGERASLGRHVEIGRPSRRTALLRAALWEVEAAMASLLARSREGEVQAAAYRRPGAETTQSKRGAAERR